MRQWPDLEQVMSLLNLSFPVCDAASHTRLMPVAPARSYLDSETLSPRLVRPQPGKLPWSPLEARGGGESNLHRTCCRPMPSGDNPLSALSPNSQGTKIPGVGGVPLPAPPASLIQSGRRGLFSHRR